MTGYDLDAINRIVAERKSAEALAAKAEPLNGHGTNQHGKPSGVDNIKSTTGGTSSEYLTARIARDRPDILERMKAGAPRGNSVSPRGDEAEFAYANFNRRTSW